MNSRPSFAQWERRSILIELAADVATEAGVVKDEGRDLSRGQRAALERLIEAAHVVRDFMRDQVPAEVAK